MKRYGKNRARNEQGFTLLEYCAGAAIIAGTVWLAMKGLGGNLNELITAIGNWAHARTADIADGGSTGDK
jgi:Flp pilus assembly pilin Flp